MAAVPRLILAHASEAPGAVVRHLFDRFVRDVREPWEPSIGLELRVARTDDPTRGPRAPLPLTQDPGLRDDDVVVLLVDDQWIAEASYERPDAWRAFEASLAGRSVLAVALSAGAFAWIGRMPGLSGAQTIQAAHLADDAARAREVAYRLAFTLLTRLAGEADRPPLTLFVSHAKRDGLGPAGEILRHLAVANPVKAWFDANDLRAGDAFRDAFDRAIETSMLLVVWTDHYTTRPWCRWELATARELRRPILVVDALERGHQRLSPLLAGLPVVRWTGRPGDAVDAAVFEALRFRVAELRAGAQRCDGELRDDAWRAREPYLSEGRAWRDPRALPLGEPPTDEERWRDPPGAPRATPSRDWPALAAAPAEERSLDGLRVQWSLADPDDAACHGVTTHHVYAVIHRLARALLARGAHLRYAGDLRPDGFTVEIADAVRDELAAERDARRLHHRVPWPTWTRLDPAAIARVAMHVEVQRGDKPAGLDVGAIGGGWPAIDYGDVRHLAALGMGLRATRDQLAQDVDALVAAGGKRAGFQGVVPGLLEEVGLALGVIGGGRPRPVYLVGGFGGFSRALAEAIGRGGELTLDGLYERFPRARDVWAAARELVPGAARPLRDPAEVYAAWAAWLDGASWSKLDNGLTDAENEELAETIDVDRVVELVVRGLRAVRGAP